MDRSHFVALLRHALLGKLSDVTRLLGLLGHLDVTPRGPTLERDSSGGTCPYKTTCYLFDAFSPTDTSNSPGGLDHLGGGGIAPTVPHGLTALTHNVSTRITLSHLYQCSSCRALKGYPHRRRIGIRSSRIEQTNCHVNVNSTPLWIWAFRL